MAGNGIEHRQPDAGGRRQGSDGTAAGNEPEAEGGERAFTVPSLKGAAVRKDPRFRSHAGYFYRMYVRAVCDRRDPGDDELGSKKNAGSVGVT